MTFDSILDNLKKDIHKEEMYKRSLLLNVDSLDVNLNLFHTSFEPLGLYSFKGILIIATDKLICNSIDCDFGFLNYFNGSIYCIDIHVIDNKVPLKDKITIPDGIKVEENLDLSLYDGQLICIRIDFLPFFYRHNAHHVCLLDVDPFEFSLSKITDKESLEYLNYYVNDVIKLIGKIVIFNFLSCTKQVNLPFKTIYSIDDIQYNTLVCLEHFVPLILKLNLTSDIKLRFDISFSSDGEESKISYIGIDEKLKFLQAIYDVIKPLFSICDSSISIYIKYSDKANRSSVFGQIYSSGEVRVNGKTGPLCNKRVIDKF